MDQGFEPDILSLTRHTAPDSVAFILRSTLYAKASMEIVGVVN